MGELDIKDAGFTLGVNFVITKWDKQTGKLLQQEKSHNRCLNSQLLGIAKFLNGEYNHTAPLMEQDYYNWIPRYLGVGTNVAAGSNLPVGTVVKVTDTRLLNEVSPRMLLPERNQIITRAGQEYIQLYIVTYLPSEYYNGSTLQEAGLFSQEEGNNCLFRITFPAIEKTENSVVQIAWTISIISVDSQNTPSEIVDKTDLENAIYRMIARMGIIEPRIDTALGILGADAIRVYASQRTTQAEVDSVVASMNEQILLLEQIDPYSSVNNTDF